MIYLDLSVWEWLAQGIAASLTLVFMIRSHASKRRLQHASITNRHERPHSSGVTP